MYKYLAKVMELTLKTVFDVSKSMFMMLVLMLVIDNTTSIVPKEINDIFLYCIIMYFVINILITNVCKFNLNNYIKICISILIISASIIIPILFINRKWDMYTFILSINFLFTSVKATIYGDNGVEKEDEINNFLYSFGAFIAVFIVVFFLGKMIPVGYVECLKKYLSIYFILGVMSLARLNLVNEYGVSNSIAINKDKNIVRVNIISFIIIMFSVTMVSLEHVKNFIKFFLEKIVYYGVNFLGKIFGSMVGDTADNIKKYARKVMVNTDGDERPYYPGKGVIDEIKELKDYIPKPVRELRTTHIKVIVFTIVVICIIIIGYIIYKNLDTKSKLKEELLLVEKKDFIFSLDDFKDSLKNLANKVQDSLNKKKIHSIRKIYIQCILKLNEKGIKYKASYTPNEYNEFIQKGYAEVKGFSAVTQLYNNLRYGNKKITNDEINIAKEIRDKL